MREYILGLKCDGARRFNVARAAENIAENFPIREGNGYRLWDGHAGRSLDNKVTSVLSNPQWPLPNVWLGTSIEDQATADDRIPHLLTTPAAVQFVSAEPLLGPVDLRIVQARGSSRVQNCVTGRSFSETSLERLPDGPRLDWVIVGGESGPHARPMHPDWVRSLRDQCIAAGVPFFFKQWGEWELSLDRDRDDPDWRADYSNNYTDRGKSRWINIEGGRGFHGDRFCVMRRVGKRASGRLLDGREWSEMPEVSQ